MSTIHALTQKWDELRKRELEIAAIESTGTVVVHDGERLRLQREVWECLRKAIGELRALQPAQDAPAIEFHLYSGSSEDGRGHPKYQRSTTDPSSAKAFLSLLCSNPYAFGHALCFFNGREQVLLHASDVDLVLKLVRR